MIKLLDKLVRLDKLKRRCGYALLVHRLFSGTNHGRSEKDLIGKYNNLVNEFNREKYFWIKKIKLLEIFKGGEEQ